ncbi:MAG TPA: hypothetical protein VNZ26_32515 [Vicinamibacterales bacterium]|jgi:uncharacterized damage-inducible protein DinB|nr:hypothetical protein [Vicinamibacterales bacterium]
MKLTDFYLAQLEAESARTRRTLERVPEGRGDWKPHDKSMPLGRLAMLVARMPSWINLIVNQDELDLSAGSNVDQRPLNTPADLVKALDEGTAGARQTLMGTTDDHLMTNWRLKMGGRVVSEEKRTNVIRDTFAHLAHHRAQLGVYLRLNDVPVPAMYGPSADDTHFA